MELVTYGVAAVAIIIMGVNAVQAYALSQRLLGGEVARKWTWLTAMIVLFFIGYLASPLALLYQAPSALLNLMMFSVFLFGAVFVLVVIGIVRDALSFLKLLK